MQIEYKIKLYYPIDRLESTLLKLPTLAEIAAGASTRIELPNGKHLVLPFTSGLQNRSIRLQYRHSGTYVDAKLIFPVDPPILAYLQVNDLEDTIDRSGNWVAIDNMYIHMRAGDRYFELYFDGYSSPLNRLLLDSKAIHATLIEFAYQTDALFGAIDIERGDYLLLTDLAGAASPAEHRQIPCPSTVLDLDLPPAWDIQYFEDEIIYDIDIFVDRSLLLI